MLFSLPVLAIAIWGAGTIAREMPVDVFRAAELYDSGARHMEIMGKKEVGVILPMIDQ